KSCFYLGSLFEAGRRPREQDKRVTFYYRKACKYDYALGCYYAAILYEHGYSIDKDLKRASYYYGKACKKGHQRACDLRKNLKRKKTAP
ncbi:MAG: sel1 repeat family protein, partial [Myxococcota bacterium]|nr:sel1 repeat family protein [Myxococcota bacterium]